jgi:hypothetical protein
MSRSRFALLAVLTLACASATGCSDATAPTEDLAPQLSETQGSNNKVTYKPNFSETQGGNN